MSGRHFDDKLVGAPSRRTSTTEKPGSDRWTSLGSLLARRRSKPSALPLIHAAAGRLSPIAPARFNFFQFREGKEGRCRYVLQRVAETPDKPAEASKTTACDESLPETHEEAAGVHWLEQPPTGGALPVRSHERSNVTNASD